MGWETASAFPPHLSGRGTRGGGVVMVPPGPRDGCLPRPSPIRLIAIEQGAQHVEQNEV